jgi:DNA-binding response OmpR family regulator
MRPRAWCACAGRRVELSQKEFALARALASDPARVFTKDELLRTIWGFRALGSDRRIAR